jgi:hypothetical protein
MYILVGSLSSEVIFTYQNKSNANTVYTQQTLLKDHPARLEWPLFNMFGFALCTMRTLDLL